MSSTISEKVNYIVLFMYLLTVSIKRPGLGLKKKDSTGCLIETFFKKSRPGRLIETVSKYINKTVQSMFSEIHSTGLLIETFEKISDQDF